MLATASEINQEPRHFESSRGLRLRIADVTTALVCGNGGPAVCVAGASRHFLVDEATPDVTIRVGWGELRQDCDAEKLFDSGALWQLYRQADRLLFRFTSPAFGPVPYKAAYFNPRFTAGDVYLHRPYFEGRGPVYPLEYPLDELLIINHLLAQGTGVELHGCGLVDRSGRSGRSGAGYLFVGQSGAGKTTMARLWEARPGVDVLSDDRIVLRIVDDEIWMYGTPWHGEAALASPARARLAGLFFLRHGVRHELMPLGRAEAVARLFATSFPPFHSATGLDSTLGLLDFVARSVPCHALAFAPDPAVIELIRQSHVGRAPRDFQKFGRLGPVTQVVDHIGRTTA